MERIPIRAVGSTIQAWVNGTLMSTLVDRQEGEADARGKIGFQIHAMAPCKVQYKDIELCQLDGATAAAAAPALKPNEYAKGGLPADQAAALMAVPDGFNVRVIAAEPDVRQPVALAIDPRGRLWVAEAFSYPTRRPDGEGKDRIRSSKMRMPTARSRPSKKVFVDNLNLIKGMEVGLAAVRVGAAPYLMFILDQTAMTFRTASRRSCSTAGYQTRRDAQHVHVGYWTVGFTAATASSPTRMSASPARATASAPRSTPASGATIRSGTNLRSAYGTSNPWGMDFDDRGQLFCEHLRSRTSGTSTMRASQRQAASTSVRTPTRTAPSPTTPTTWQDAARLQRAERRGGRRFTPTAAS
ncbi:MAG: family 16 glycoside hydrolase [Verrucomicrobiales bacterium]